MKLLFDKGLGTERSLTVDTINEHVTEGNLIASMSAELSTIGSSAGVSEFANERRFSTIEAISGDNLIPIIGTYNYIASMSLMYTEMPPRYSINLSINYKAPENKEEKV